MHNDVTRASDISRRSLLKGVAGFGLGSLALSLPGTLAARTSLRAQMPFTEYEINDLGGPWNSRPLSRPLLSVASYSSAVATDWYRMAIKLVRETPGFSPPVGSRAFAYMSVALYEGIAPGITGSQSLAGQLNGLTKTPAAGDAAYHWPTVASSAMAAMSRLLFPTASEENQAAIDELETEYAQILSAGLPRQVVRRSVTRGQAVAAHVFAWSQTDGGHEGFATSFPPDFKIPTGAGLWVPTSPDNPIPLQPYWGQNRPFALADVADYDPGPPPAFSTEPGSTFYKEAYEVYQAVEELDEEQRAIALFWADGGKTVTAPGHVIAILTQLLEERDTSLVTAAEAYVKATIAVADAIISCWDTKFRYNLIRPVTYIQQHIDAGWGVGDRALPVGTPPFPEYTSGHSVQTAAFAQVMEDLFGDLPFTDHTHADRGLEPRSFTTWDGMAEETAISRLYGGIHFRSAIEIGIDQGRAVGKRASALRFRSRPPAPIGGGNIF